LIEPASSLASRTDDNDDMIIITIVEIINVGRNIDLSQNDVGWLGLVGGC